MGHSMGGAIVLTLASTPEYKDLVSQLSGILLESPYIANTPSLTPNPIVVFVGKMAGKLLPHFQIVQALAPAVVVHDPEVQESVAADPLIANTGTLEMFANMLERGAQLKSGQMKLNDGVKAIWLAHGNGDECTDYDASKQWFEREGQRIPDREFKTYEGWSHQLHADMPEHRPVFAKDVADWILKRCPEQKVHMEQAKL